MSPPLTTMKYTLIFQPISRHFYQPMAFKIGQVVGRYRPYIIYTSIHSKNSNYYCFKSISSIFQFSVRVIPLLKTDAANTLYSGPIGQKWYNSKVWMSIVVRIQFLPIIMV